MFLLQWFIAQIQTKQLQWGGGVMILLHLLKFIMSYLRCKIFTILGIIGVVIPWLISLGFPNTSSNEKGKFIASWSIQVLQETAKLRGGGADSGLIRFTSNWRCQFWLATMWIPEKDSKFLSQLGQVSVRALFCANIGIHSYKQQIPVWFCLSF